MRNATPPSGWYPDPDGSGGQRFWDGAAWTSASTPAPTTSDRPQPHAAGSGLSAPAATPATAPSLPTSAPPAALGTSGNWPTASQISGVAVAAGGIAQHLRALPRAAWAAGIAAALVGIVLIGGGNRTEHIEGSFSLIDGAFMSQANGSPCRGSGGYSDISPGLQVRASDDTGRLIASSTLEGGRVDGITCVFTFELRDVPHSSYYTFEVGRRGEMSYSHDEMVANGWNADFSLGEY